MAEEAAAEAAAKASEAAAREAAASAEAAVSRAAASEAKGEAALMASELEISKAELEARSAELTISMELRREVERRAAEELEACRLAAHAAARTRQAEVRSRSFYLSRALFRPLTRTLSLNPIPSLLAPLNASP